MRLALRERKRACEGEGMRKKGIDSQAGREKVKDGERVFVGERIRKNDKESETDRERGSVRVCETENKKV